MPAIQSVLAATALIGGGITAYGQYQEGQKTKEVEDYNAKVAEQEAGVIRKNAMLTEFKQRKQLKQATGEMVAATAGSGIELTGSPLNVIADSISNAELDISIDKYNAEVEARNKESEARLRRYYGREAVKSSYYNMGSTLLTTGTEAYGRYSNRASKTTQQEIGLGGSKK